MLDQDYHQDSRLAEISVLAHPWNQTINLIRSEAAEHHVCEDGTVSDNRKGKEPSANGVGLGDMRSFGKPLKLKDVTADLNVQEQYSAS